MQGLRSQARPAPALVRDVSIDYTALSLVAPEKVHFKYKLRTGSGSMRRR